MWCILGTLPPSENLAIHYSGDEIKKSGMGGACSTYGGEMHTGFLWRNLRERDHLEEQSYKFEDNIKMDLQKVGCEGMDWIYLTQGQVAGACECGNTTSDSIKCGRILDWLETC